VVGTALVSKDASLSPVEIGDTKQPDFKPQIKFPRFDNYANASFRLVSDEPAAVSYEQDAVIWRTATLEAKFYGIDDLEARDGHEFEVRLFERPASNVLTFSVQVKGVTWWYQPPLKNLRDDGWTWEPNEWGGIRQRPPHVNGSYAGYCDREGDYSALGGHNYRTGKVLHIYRPWAEDAKGQRVWCDLTLDADVMTITVPQDFLDSAAYPVLVDPTFGYSGTAASDDNISTARASCARRSRRRPSAARSTSITIKGRNEARARWTRIMGRPSTATRPGHRTPSWRLWNGAARRYGASDAEVTNDGGHDCSDVGHAVLARNTSGRRGARVDNTTGTVLVQVRRERRREQPVFPHGFDDSVWEATASRVFHREQRKGLHLRDVHGHGRQQQFRLAVGLALGQRVAVGLGEPTPSPSVSPSASVSPSRRCRRRSSPSPSAGDYDLLPLSLIVNQAVKRASYY
jgi:hypothetical protein